MDKVIIKSAKFFCNVGVKEKERKKRQLITLDIKLYKNLAKACESDDIKDTIDYSNVYDFIKKVIESRKYNLIEKIAEDIAEKIIKNFKVNKVCIFIRKPKALGKKAEYAAVEITRESG